MLVTVRGWKVNRQWFKTMTSSRDEQIAREDLSELTVQVKFGSQRKWCVNLTLTENITFFMALGWTPESWRARGRPKATCRRSVVRERGKVGWKSWNLAKVAAPDGGGLGGQCDSLMHLLALQAMMMMMMIMMKMKVLIEFLFLTGTFLWICWEQYSTTYSCRGNREVQPEGFSRA